MVDMFYELCSIIYRFGRFLQTVPGTKERKSKRQIIPGTVKVLFRVRRTNVVSFSLDLRFGRAWLHLPDSFPF